MTAEVAPPQRRGCFGCARWLALALVVAVIAGLAIGLIFDQGSDADQPVRGINAGTAEQYARGDVTYIDAEHVYVVRLEDGGFLALYDKSPKQQALGSDCRVRYDETAVLPAIVQLSGFTGALVEECEDVRAVWRVDGAFAAGSGFGDLDRFGTSTNKDGDLIVDTRTRTCTKSRGVAGIPPFDVTTCNGAD